MKKVSIIIINWNGRQHLELCLPSVMAQTYPNFEVILFDNGSTDGSIEWVQAKYPQVRLIQSPENVGFAEGNNRGIQAARGDYIVTLNNDTQVEENWLAELVRTVELDTRVGMVASKMLSLQRPELIDSGGIYVNRAGIVRDRFRGMLDTPEAQEVEEIFGPCAGAALYRRAMLDEIGLFDGDFFIYMDDVDLAWRGQLAGWRCLYAPAARVYHAYSATTGENSPFKNRLMARNKVWLIIKDYPWPQLGLYLPLILFYDLLTIPYRQVIKGDLSHFAGRWAGLRALPAVMQKRRQTQALLKKNSRRESAQFLAPVESWSQFLAYYSWAPDWFKAK